MISLILIALLSVLSILAFLWFLKTDGKLRAGFEYGITIPPSCRNFNSEYSKSRISKLFFGEHIDGTSTTSFLMDSSDLNILLIQFEDYQHFCGQEASKIPCKGKIDFNWTHGEFSCLLIQPFNGLFRRKPYGDYLSILIRKTRNEEELKVTFESDWN